MCICMCVQCHIVWIYVGDVLSVDSGVCVCLWCANMFCGVSLSVVCSIYSTWCVLCYVCSVHTCGGVWCVNIMDIICGIWCVWHAVFVVCVLVVGGK